MAEDQFNTNANWWDSSTRNRFEVAGSSSSSSSGLNNSLGSFGWPTEMAADIKSRTSMDSSSVVHGGGVPDSAADLQMMGLGLSTQAMDWNQALLRGDNNNKSDQSSFRLMLQETNLNSNASFPQEQWRSYKNMFSGVGSSSDHNSTVTSSFQMDSSSAVNLYGTSSSSSILQGLLGSENQQQQPSSMNYHQYASNEMLPSWSKVPQFLRGSPPKQAPPPHSQLHFSNNATFWNPSATSISDIRPSFFPSLQMQTHQYSAHPHPPAEFEEKPKNISEVREASTVVKKSGSEPASKRTRNDTAPSTLPAFKVRKEKMGDRITALQQLVSPFGKTDTASVLSEAIEYIKFLHEQVTVLSTPYMKSGASSIQQQQSSDKSSKDPEGPKQDLRSRGLCLVPVSSTFPVTQETAVDFWTPTFGGTFR